ncbi:hypothetical protein SK128_027337 [Halocaridina rubra]|uniref:Uncharacterized protein n=1 Tax=Halocaridina rubra TaxID=373956 RepID=A0AAN9ABT9_HALRR
MDVSKCHYMWRSQHEDIWRVARELQQYSTEVDVTLKGKSNTKESSKLDFREANNRDSLRAHRLILAAASPFLSKVLKDHCSCHHCEHVDIILPDIAHDTLRYILEFLYCGRISSPPWVKEKVKAAAEFLQIENLVKYLRSDNVLSGSRSTTRKAKIKEGEACSDSPKKVPPKKRGRKSYEHDYQAKCNNSSPVILCKKIKIETNEHKIENTTAVNCFSHSRRKIKCKYDPDLYRINLPEISDLKVRRCNILKRKDENRLSLENNVVQQLKNENLHTYALRSPDNGIEIDNENQAEKIVDFPDSSINILNLNSRKDHLKLETNAPILSPSIPTSSSISTAVIPILFTTNASDINECEDIPCSAFTGPSTSKTAVTEDPSQATPLPSSLISEIEDLPVVSSPTLNNCDMQSTLKFIPDLCKPHSINSLPDDEDEEEEPEEDDGLFKLQVLLKDCEDFHESLNCHSSNPIKSQCEGGLEPKFEEPSDGLDIRQWISEEFENTGIRKMDKQIQSELDNENENQKVKLCDVNADERTCLPVEYTKSEEVTYKCQNCGRVYPDFQSRKIHIQNFHKEAKQMCKHCGKMFKRRCDLYVHERRHNVANLPCRICGKVFKLPKDLKAHTRTHIGGKRYKCVKCNRELTSFRNLKNHIASVHHKEKPHACHMCDKTYTKVAALEVHIRSAHTGERPYVCKICSKAFCNPNLLRIHEVSHTGEQKYSCKICCRKFSQYCNMVTHLRVHSSERPYECVICKERYKTKESLLKHKWTHTGLKPLRCRHCLKEYRIKESYERHMLKCHDEVVHLPQIYFEMSQRVVLENMQNIVLNTSGETVNNSASDETFSNIPNVTGKGSSIINLRENFSHKLEASGELNSTLTQNIAPSVQFVNDLAQEETTSIALTTTETGQLHLNSDAIQISYPILPSPSKDEGMAETLSIVDHIPSETDISNPIESLLEVAIPVPHTSVMMSEDCKVNILLDC